MKDGTKIKLVAIPSIAALECVALLTGIDGALFTLVVGGICGLAGYEIRAKRE